MAQITDGLKYDLYGDKELNAFFNDCLKFGQQKSVMVSAYRRAGKTIIKTARTLLRARRKHRGTGNLHKSFGAKPGKGRNPSLLIGARRVKQFKGHHGHLFSAGTKRRYKKSGAYTGQVKGTNLWPDTIKYTSKAVQDNMQTEIYTSLSKLVQRNLKRMNKAS